MQRFIVLIVSILIGSVILFHDTARAQCANNNTFLTDLTPAYSGDTVTNGCIKAGEYITTSVISGNIYVFSTCGQNAVNTQMTLRNSTGSVWYAFNDNFCSQQSQITWTATFTGSVRLLIDEAPSCGHDTICQEIFVTTQCQADAGTVQILKNGSSASSTVYLCEGQDTLEVNSNNDYTLPPADSGEIAELMYFVFSCPPTSSNPELDSCNAGFKFTDKDFTESNPGLLSTGTRYYIQPVTVDDGDNGTNPNGQINLDGNGDRCYDVGQVIEVVYLSPIAFASNLVCTTKSVSVSIYGGISEYDSSSYTITNTGSGTIAGLPVSHSGSLLITGLENGDNYSFIVTDNNGCSRTFSGGPLSVPDAGEDTAFSVCVTDSAFHLDSMIKGNPDTNGTWYNPSNSVNSGIFTPGISPTGTWYYVINGFSVCDDDTSFMEIGVDSAYDAGVNSMKTICQYDSMQNLWNQLSSADFIGQWYDHNNNAFNGNLNLGTSLFTSRTYIYRINGNSSCQLDSSTHEIQMNKFPIAGQDSSIDICSNDMSFNMIDYLSGQPDTGGTWSFAGSGTSGIFDPASDSSGSYKYTVNGISPCPDTSASLSITTYLAPNPGIGSNQSFCRNDTIQDLFQFLSGSPDLNGHWLDPNGDTLNNTSVDPATAMSGNYIYHVPGPMTCEDSSAQVSISFTEAPNPGLSDSLQFCSNDGSIELLGLMSNTPDSTGSWRDPNNNPFNGMFDPAVDAQGLYIYTVNGIGPCTDSNSYHAISTIQAPNPGLDSSIDFCTLDQPTDLTIYIGSGADSNGTWTDPFNNTFTQPFDPSTHIAGKYVYKVNGISPCRDSSSEVVVGLVSPPDPGLDGIANFCSSDSATNLKGYLNGNPDPGGSWKDSSGNSFSGTFFPASTPEGVYTYTVAGSSPCPDSSAKVTVTVYLALNPGTNTSVDKCSNESIFYLFSELNGNPDSIGSWKDPSGFNHSGLFNPATDSSGTYTYLISGIGTCKDTSSELTVNVVRAPNPGLGQSVTFCSNDPSVSLFSFLGMNPDSTGNWTDPNNQMFGNTFDPSTDTSGIYTYTVTGITPCVDSSSQLLIGVNNFANAGANNNIDVCETDSAFNMFNQLNGTPDFGGTWKNNLGITRSGFFDPSSDSTGLFSYTVSGNAPCLDSTSYLQVTVIQNVNAGRDSLVKFCNNISPVNLFTILPGSPDPGGSWLNHAQLPFNGILDPSLDSNGLYTYRVTGQHPCPDKTSILTIDINHFYQAGEDASKIICATDAPFNFFNELNGDPDPFGFWSTPSDSVFDGISSSVQLESGRYRYTLENESPCPHDSAFVDLLINEPPNAGIGSSKTLCEDDLPIQLFDQLSGNPEDSGLWYNPSGNGFSGIFNPSSHLEGRYVYVVEAEPPCAHDSSFVEMSVAPLPDAGEDDIIDVCWNTETDLSTKIDSQLSLNTIWLYPDGSPMNGIFDPFEDETGTYFLVAPSNSYCPSDLANVEIRLTEEFEIYAGPDIFLVVDEEKRLKAISTVAKTFKWEPEDGLSDPEVHDPKVFTDVTTEYIVRGYDRNGCEVSDTMKVTVLPKFYAPNAFTPSGDGLNETWYVIGLSEYPGARVFVYNEDRIPVFSTDDPKERWDGTFQGRDVPVGNYYYIIEFPAGSGYQNETGIISLIR